MHARIMQLVLATIALGAIGVVLTHLREDSPGEKVQSASASDGKTNAGRSSEESLGADAAVGSELVPAAAAVEHPRPLTPAEIARLIETTGSSNASARATAIVALADAPKSEAIPTLRRVLEGGEPTIDRPLALQSLRDLALNQGDEDGAIRGIVREAMYHTDDEGVVRTAELALEIIEESEMR